MQATASGRALRLFTYALALLLTACGEMRWTRPGGDHASAGNDLANCRVAAHSSTERMYGPMLPPVTSGGQFGNAPVGPTPADRQMREQETVNRCMRDKGYALVPVDG